MSAPLPGSLERLHWSRRIYRRINQAVSPIAFSMTLDDHQVIERALDVRSGDVVVALSSAGDTPLNLLAHDPARIDAVDISWPQIHLLRLKQAAMPRLELPEFRTLLGLGPPGDPVALYQVVRRDLDQQTRQFWDAHRELLARGVAWQGSVQRMSAVWGPLARWRDNARSGRLGAGANPYLAPLLLRQLPPDDLLPPYLTACRYRSIAAVLDRLHVSRADIRQHLAAAPGSSIDCFALSNVADWLTRADLALLCEQILRTARPGARVILCSHRRGFSVPGRFAASLHPHPEPPEAWLRLDRVRYFRSIHVLLVGEDQR